MNAGLLTAVIGSVVAVATGTATPILLLRMQQARQERVEQEKRDARTAESSNVSWQSLNNALAKQNEQLTTRESQFRERIDQLDANYQKQLAETRDECEERARRLQERIKSLEAELAVAHERIAELERVQGGGRAR